MEMPSRYAMLTLATPKVAQAVNAAFAVAPLQTPYKLLHAASERPCGIHNALCLRQPAGRRRTSQAFQKEKERESYARSPCIVLQRGLWEGFLTWCNKDYTMITRSPYLDPGFSAPDWPDWSYCHRNPLSVGRYRWDLLSLDARCELGWRCTRQHTYVGTGTW